jgi:hypothetical protein
MAVLDLLSIGETEPLEAIDEEALGVEPGASMDNVLSELLDLHKKGLISIHQIPLPSTVHQFAQKDLSPETVDEIFGDLVEESKEYRKKRASLNKTGKNAEAEPGIPLGIYFKITERGEFIIVSLTGDTIN